MSLQGHVYVTENALAAAWLRARQLWNAMLDVAPRPALLESRYQTTRLTVSKMISQSQRTYLLVGAVGHDACGSIVRCHGYSFSLSEVQNVQLLKTLNFVSKLCGPICFWTRSWGPDGTASVRGDTAS